MRGCVSRIFENMLEIGIPLHPKTIAIIEFKFYSKIFEFISCLSIIDFQTARVSSARPMARPMGGTAWHGTTGSVPVSARPNGGAVHGPPSWPMTQHGHDTA